ncbi:MAG: hypothetical protein LJE62_15040 [Silicimonas sp.]|jgi:opacity protein-like surface antigen|nr:hypothetical protein [Silicimonas sp.]
MTMMKIFCVAAAAVVCASGAMAKGHLPPTANPPEFADHVTAKAGARAAESEKGASQDAKDLEGLGNSKDKVVPGD